MFRKPARKVSRVFLHCTASDLTKHDNVAAIRQMHLDRGWSDIGYHLFIKKNGSLENGRPLEKIPAAQRGHNTNSIAICLHGLKEENFTKTQFDTLKKLCLEINKAYDGKISFHGHREVAAKACPVFDYKKVLKLDKFGALGISGSVKTATEDTNVKDHTKLPDLEEGTRGAAVELLQELLFIKIDGVFGPKTADSVKKFKKKHNLFPSDKVVSHVWKLLLSAKEVEHFD